MSPEERRLLIETLLLMILDFGGTMVLFNLLWIHQVSLLWLFPWFIFLVFVLYLWAMKYRKR